MRPTLVGNVIPQGEKKHWFEEIERFNVFYACLDLVHSNWRFWNFSNHITLCSRVLLILGRTSHKHRVSFRITSPKGCLGLGCSDRLTRVRYMIKHRRQYTRQSIQKLKLTQTYITSALCSDPFIGLLFQVQNGAIYHDMARLKPMTLCYMGRALDH